VLEEGGQGVAVGRCSQVTQGACKTSEKRKSLDGGGEHKARSKKAKTVQKKKEEGTYRLESEGY